MGFFSKSYEPGGEHHIRITDETFQEAQELVANDESVSEYVRENDCLKYEAHDFPVTEILGSFLVAYELQEEKNGVPEEFRIANIRLGRKDLVEYNKFVDRHNAHIDRVAAYEKDAWDQKGVGGKLFSFAAGAAAKGIKQAATGKSEDVRWFEKTFSNYLCGDSSVAKEYLLNFATEFGGHDDGLVDVVKTIRAHYQRAEFAKYNRSR